MKKQQKIQLTSYEELLGIETDIDKIHLVDISELHSFKNHPFHVNDDTLMNEMVQSVQYFGILHPIIVRTRNAGGYEILSGHRRRHAALLAGIKQVPVIIKECSDDEAVMTMVDSNLQRETLLPSEKAYAYRMKTEAMKHQGIKGAEAGETADQVGKPAGDSGRTVQRYIRLTYLRKELLDMVDNGKIKLTPGFYLSYLTQEEQKLVAERLKGRKVSISAGMAKQLKAASEEASLSEAKIDLICRI